MPLVLVRTPTYRRPDMLKRAIRCLQAQTHGDWICEVRDDCPEASARIVVEELRDPRVRYVHNRPQKFGVRNLDDCFSLENPFQADYFFMLEDDNQVRPEFMARGQEIIEQEGVKLCQINQVIEHGRDTESPCIGNIGIFDEVYDQRVYHPSEIHLAIFGSTGTSNGALFWSRGLRTNFTIPRGTLPSLDEYLRTSLIIEPIYVSREKLAVWAESEQSTLRNLGLNKGYVRRELDLKASITELQRRVWARTTPSLRTAFLNGEVLRIPLHVRLEAMRKAGIKESGVPGNPNFQSILKRWAVRHVGHVHSSVEACTSNQRKHHFAAE